MGHLSIAAIIWVVLAGGWLISVCVMGLIGVVRWRQGNRLLTETLSQYEHTMAEARERYDRAQYERQVAARALFEAVLRPEQVTEYDTYGYITVRTPANHRYRVSRFGTPIIAHNDGGAPYRAFCLVSSEDLPSLDLVVQNVLLLETDEEAFLRAANPTYPTTVF